MSTVTTDSNFSGIKDMSSDLDISSGDNEQVLALAAFQNMGQAIADDDIYPEGEYVIHTFPGMFQMVVIKHSKHDYTFVTKVYNHVIEDYKKQLQIKKDKVAANEGNDGNLTWDAPPWVVLELAVNLGVHPLLDEKSFEEALYKHYPYLWLDEKRAPKRIIT